MPPHVVQPQRDDGTQVEVHETHGVAFGFPDSLDRSSRLEVFEKDQPARSLHRYVLLDAQDWMTTEQMTDLWTQIDRTADEEDARVIFRTAGAESPLPRKLPSSLLGAWAYLENESRAFHAQDRSSIYGGFHVYARRRAS